MTATYDEIRAAIVRICLDSFFYLHLEPTNACNTSCTMCPRDAMDRKLRMMEWDTFLRAVDLLLPAKVPMVSIVGFGEPTLHPRLVEMIRHIRAERPGVIVKMTTNGSRLTPSAIDALYAAGLDLMEISVVGTDLASYSATMGGLDPARMLAAVAHLNRHDHTYLLATFPLGGASSDDLRRYWMEMGARRVEVKGFHTRGGYLEQPGALARDSLGDYQRRAGTLQLRPYRDREPQAAVDACHKLYMFLHVNADGNLIPCVQEINNRNVIGHIGSLDTFDQVRTLMRTQRPVFDICRGCQLRSQDQIDYYARFVMTYFPGRADEMVQGEVVAKKSTT